MAAYCSSLDGVVQLSTSPMPTTEWILRNRPRLLRPSPGGTLLGHFDEWEATLNGPVRTRTLFLRGSECRFHCTMCDLWQHTHAEPTRRNAIPQQIEQGLDNIATTDPKPIWLKLYNAASFFDSKNIPTQDLPTIAQLVRPMQRVIVENHPRLVFLNALSGFLNQILPTRLELAMGLETVHADVLQKLNKQMTVADFRLAVEVCHSLEVAVRAFVLLQTPWLNRPSSLDWCQATIDAARDMGVQHISVIPVRGGNGAMEQLVESGDFTPPTAAMLEEILAKNLSHGDSLVTVDLWDWDKLRGTCAECSQPRLARMVEMNLDRRVLPTIRCRKCDAS